MASDPRVRTFDEIKTVHLFDIVVDLCPPVNFGASR